MVCPECSPPPKLNVEGYSGFQRVCKKCIKSRDLQVQELDAAAEEAALQSTAARENAQRAKDDKMGTASDSDVSGASLFLDLTLSAAVAAKEFGRADTLNHKLAKVRDLDSQRSKIQSELTNANEIKDFSRCLELDAALKALPALTLPVAIALDAFPINTIVRASVASSNGVVSGTAGEVIGYSSNGKVEVRFKAGENVAFEVATLRVADLPDNWTVKQSCISVVELPGEVSIGQSGSVVGWSKPFDCDKIMVEFGGRQVNVHLIQIETMEQFKVRQFLLHEMLCP